MLKMPQEPGCKRRQPEARSDIRTGSEDKDEPLQVCDADGRPAGRAPRAACHNGSRIPHLAVHVIVERPDGALILQKRSIAKQIQPGKWDTSVGGHVRAGEDVLSAARRELEEELGIRGVEPEELYRYWWQAEVECEYVVSYHLVCAEARASSEEIQEVRAWRPEEVKAAPADIFTPNFLEEFKRFRQWRGKR